MGRVTATNTAVEESAQEQVRPQPVMSILEVGGWGLARFAEGFEQHQP